MHEIGTRVFNVIISDFEGIDRVISIIPDFHKCVQGVLIHDEYLDRICIASLREQLGVCFWRSADQIIHGAV